MRRHARTHTHTHTNTHTHTLTHTHSEDTSTQTCAHQDTHTLSSFSRRLVCARYVCTRPHTHTHRISTNTRQQHPRRRLGLQIRARPPRALDHQGRRQARPAGFYGRAHDLEGPPSLPSHRPVNRWAKVGARRQALRGAAGAVRGTDTDVMTVMMTVL